jgi:outer membrane protein OmpA-like peptidoglycan-associated protein
LVSLPLMIQPAAAVQMGDIHQSSASRHIILAQAAPDAEGEGQGEEQLRPRRQKGQAQGEEQGGSTSQRAAPSGQDSESQQQQKPRRQRPADSEPGSDGSGQGATPRRAQQSEQPGEEPPARSQRQQQRAQDAEGGSETQPRRDRQRQQAEPETGGAAGEQAQPRSSTEGSSGQRARTKEAAPADQGGTEAPAAPKPPRNATQESGSQEQQRKGASQRSQSQQPSDEQAPATQQGTQRPERKSAPAEGTGQTQQRREQPATGQATEGQQPTETQPAVRQRSLSQPATGQSAPSAEQPAASGQAAPAAPTAPAPNQAEQVQPGADQQQTQPATAASPQQLQRAKQLAQDPASAKSGEQVTLPVENGAAVLDSAKEAPGRPRRDATSRQQSQQADQQLAAPPRSDADAQQNTRISREQQQEFRALSERRGERLDGRPDFERPRGWEFRGPAEREGGRDRDSGRVIISIDNQPVDRHDDSRRFYERGGRGPQYERLSDDSYREVIERDDGTRVVTIRNRYGEIVQRTRVVRGGEEYVLYEAPELMDERRGRDYVWRDPGDDLPPMRLTVPLDRYIIDTSSEPDRDYYEFLEQPPVEPVERVYSLDEVRYSARIRDKVPRIDLDTITFATGSAEIPMNQASSLRKIADAINKVLQNDPSETFLIEGHTDAVGSDQDNLVLSDERAESVARVLSDAFNIPPENLATQGYGEQYLKVRTDGPNQENRRVTIRRITPLVKPVASNR